MTNTTRRFTTGPYDRRLAADGRLAGELRSVSRRTDRPKARSYHASVLGPAVLLAIGGLVVHNLLSLPTPPWSPETLGPVAVYLGLWLWHVAAHGSRPARWAFLGWTLLNLVVGGILTVLPLGFLPFVPDQSAGHYFAHVIYATTQIPLAWLCLRGARVAGAADGGSTTRTA